MHAGEVATMGKGPEVGLEGRPVWLEYRARESWLSRRLESRAGFGGPAELWVLVFCTLGSLHRE